MFLNMVLEHSCYPPWGAFSFIALPLWRALFSTYMFLGLQTFKFLKPFFPTLLLYKISLSFSFPPLTLLPSSSIEKKKNNTMISHFFFFCYSSTCGLVLHLRTRAIKKTKEKKIILFSILFLKHNWTLEHPFGFVLGLLFMPSIWWMLF